MFFSVDYETWANYKECSVPILFKDIITYISDVQQYFLVRHIRGE